MIGFPKAAAKFASLKASDKVGCAWQTRAISSQEAPYSNARAASFTISPAPLKWKIVFKAKVTPCYDLKKKKKIWLFHSFCLNLYYHNSWRNQKSFPVKKTLGESLTGEAWALKPLCYFYVCMLVWKTAPLPQCCQSKYEQ